MALMHVYEERGLKREDELSKQQVNVIFFFFWTSFYELITVIALFWLDILPAYGYADNLNQFMDKYVWERHDRE